MKKLIGEEQVVIFVCEHGSAKSVVAAAHFNKLAKERNLPVRAISRGTNPDEEIAPIAASGLQADGLAAGEENLLAREGHALGVRVEVTNLGNVNALYNFLSTFSGTHFLAGRTLTAGVHYSF